MDYEEAEAEYDQGEEAPLPAFYPPAMYDPRVIAPTYPWFPQAQVDYAASRSSRVPWAAVRPQGYSNAGPQIVDPRVVEGRFDKPPSV